MNSRFCNLFCWELQQCSCSIMTIHIRFNIMCISISFVSDEHEIQQMAPSQLLKWLFIPKTFPFLWNANYSGKKPLSIAARKLLTCTVLFTKNWQCVQAQLFVNFEENVHHWNVCTVSSLITPIEISIIKKKSFFCLLLIAQTQSSSTLFGQPSTSTGVCYMFEFTR